MITVKRKVQFTRDAKGRRRVTAATKEQEPIEPGRVPRISRLMAVAIRMEAMLRSGEVSGIDELARLGHVTQPRMSQILNLTLLAPDIQEELLFLPRVTAGKSAIHEKMLRPISAKTAWSCQREMWRATLHAPVIDLEEIGTVRQLSEFQFLGVGGDGGGSALSIAAVACDAGAPDRRSR